MGSIQIQGQPAASKTCCLRGDETNRLKSVNIVLKFCQCLKMPIFFPQALGLGVPAVEHYTGKTSSDSLQTTSNYNHILGPENL